MAVTVTTGAIQQCSTQAIVNAANEGLHEGGGVCGAIFDAVRRAGGHAQLTSACRAIGHCPTGDAVITPSFGLPAPWIIHAVGPVWRGQPHRTPEALDSVGARQLQELASAYRAVIRVCRENKISSVAIPGISTGIFGLPKELGSAIAVRVCRQDGEGIDINLVAYDKESHDILVTAPSSTAVALLGEIGL